MSLQADLIGEAIKAGKLTVCPPMDAAGDLKLPKKKRKGERVRPCAHCETPVQFLKGKWKVNGKRREGWHWTNAADDNHHMCRNFRQVSNWSPSPARPKETKAAKAVAVKAQAPLQGKRDWQPGPDDFNDELPI